MTEEQNPVEHDDTPEPPKVQREILRALKGVRYGSVEIVIHDSKVVQVERREKFRFQKDAE
jgi:hypothetical protein